MTMSNDSKVTAQDVADVRKAHPEWTYNQIGNYLGISPPWTRQLMIRADHLGICSMDDYRVARQRVKEIERT